MIYPKIVFYHPSFIVYTTDCVSQDPTYSFVKFVDNATIVSLLCDIITTERRSEDSQIGATKTFLQPNVRKIKEIITDFRTKKKPNVNTSVH